MDFKNVVFVGSFNVTMQYFLLTVFFLDLTTLPPSKYAKHHQNPCNVFFVFMLSSMCFSVKIQ